MPSDSELLKELAQGLKKEYPWTMAKLFGKERFEQMIGCLERLGSQNL
jgi:hypothetical protein